MASFKYGGVRNMARIGRFAMSDFRQRIRVLNEKKCVTAAQLQSVLNEMAELTEAATLSGVVMVLIEEFQQLLNLNLS